MTCNSGEAEEEPGNNKSTYAVVKNVTVSGKEGKYKCLSACFPYESFDECLVLYIQ